MCRLPSDPEERQRWIKAIQRDNIPDSPNTVVKHFPPGFPVLKKKGKSRPRDRHQYLKTFQRASYQLLRPQSDLLRKLPVVRDLKHHTMSCQYF